MTTKLRKFCGRSAVLMAAMLLHVLTVDTVSAAEWEKCRVGGQTFGIYRSDGSWIMLTLSPAPSDQPGQHFTGHAEGYNSPTSPGFSNVATIGEVLNGIISPDGTIQFTITWFSEHGVMQWFHGHATAGQEFNDFTTGMYISGTEFNGDGSGHELNWNSPAHVEADQAWGAYCYPPQDKQEGADRPGNDYASAGAENADACWRRCRQDNRCAAYTFVGPTDPPPGISPDTCFLKSPAPAAVKNPCCVSGVVTKHDFLQDDPAHPAGQVIARSPFPSLPTPGQIQQTPQPGGNAVTPSAVFPPIIDSPAAIQQAPNASNPAAPVIIDPGVQAAITARDAACVTYADEATRDAQQNLILHCGGVGPRWTPVRQAHLDWCMGLPITDRRPAAVEEDARQKFLELCPGQAPPQPPSGGVAAVPPACSGGMVRGATGTCACPFGAHWNGRICVAAAIPPAQLPTTGVPALPTTCFGRMVRTAAGCACPSATHWDGRTCVVDSAALPARPGAMAPCPDPGQHRDPRSGVCFSCSHNDHFENGRCVANSGAVTCLRGTRLVNGVCVADVAAPPARCPLGMTGIPPTCCPPGTLFKNGTCEKPGRAQAPHPVQAACPPDRPVGVFPNCCPPGRQFQNGACVSACPPGYKVLDHPNRYGAYCEAAAATHCPRGWSGAPPNCRPPPPPVAPRQPQQQAQPIPTGPAPHRICNASEHEVLNPQTGQCVCGPGFDRTPQGCASHIN